ncbi:VCBS repeat-containing protein [Flavivirga algicola]|uniref:VCBS repeat-containing protein n=1 Tax=Flavivirga algicola TaxID=2729136 RepID=A0ABX1S0C9_9FLAO|nr:VCBS repeat-containing protein [Flavivirga algicola]NMH89309.1 VCBS repeat-containing protein [Flavivirga algicola]
MYPNKFVFIVISSVLIFFGCEKPNKTNTLFKSISKEHSNINFNNILTETDSLNYFIYPYLYLGGGVAAGDINNDGLSDIFFVGNMVENKLYLNKGKMKFEDITMSSNLKGDSKWHTGVTMCDVNNDGYLDIYLNVSGKEENKQNKLYINNKDLTFTESAQAYGIADNGSSIQSVFFDFDNDGDLDLYVANYPVAPFGSPNAFYLHKMKNLKHEESDHLYENLGNGKFEDITHTSGIANYGLTLGVSVGDFNTDGYQDIYISNDFNTPDKFFINNGDGTFTDKLKLATYQTAWFGMGTDAADYNNDGLLDIMQVDMTPRDNRRAKENMASMNASLFWNTVKSGFHYQYMFNSLQLNRGINPKKGVQFSNTARIAGVSTTDWSWAPLFADFDNDGWKDIFITNGIKRDVNNKDFFKAKMAKANFTGKIDGSAYQKIPSEPIENHAYKNNGDLTFTNVGENWGINLKGFSHGCAYADFDNDGDLDLVINNMDQTASLYQNQLETQGRNYLRMKLNGSLENHFGIGSKVKLYHKGKIQYQELMLTRGYESSVEPILHFGVDNIKTIDSLTITWPDGRSQSLVNVNTNQILNINYPSTDLGLKTKNKAPKFEDITQTAALNFKHKENEHSDYLFEPLLPHQNSKLGTGLAVADVNNDGLDDFYVGNAHKEHGVMYLQNNDGSFSENAGPWLEDNESEDMGALFFDADGDNDQDLYVVSGGNEFLRNKEPLQDRLYINNGNGKFKKATHSLPIMLTSGSCVKSGDYDNDGDLDLFVAGRLIPGKYPLAPRSYILRNDGMKANEPIFTDVTEQIAPDAVSPGLVTDALWSDFNNDDQLDLIITGEWMPILFFENNNGIFKNKTETLGLQNQIGWWYSLAEGDFDKDGDKDYIAGNLGLNYKYQATNDEPFELYSGDFDKNKRLDIVLGYHQDGNKYPVRGRQCSSEQIPAISLKYKDYSSFANASLVDIYGQENLENALHLSATTFASSIIINNKQNPWKIKPLPSLAQLSSINSIIIKDFNADDNLDIILAGNLYTSEVETPRNDANLGLYLTGNGKGQFKVIDASKSGLYLDGDVKQIELIKADKGEYKILSVANDDYLKIINIKN